MKFSILPILGVVFITLKLCGVIAWSWWWVLAPFWIGFAILLAVVAFLGLIAVALQRRAVPPKRR